MSDQERDPAAAGPEDATEPELADEDAPADEDAEAADDWTDEAEESAGEYIEDAEEDIETLTEAEYDALDAAEEMPVDRAAGAAASETRSRHRSRDAAGAMAAPTAADEAVHIDDRASRWFVVVTVGVFVALLAWAIVAGNNGLLSDAFKPPKATEAPIVTIAPASPAASPASS